MAHRLGFCLKYSDNAVFIAAKTDEDYQFLLRFFTGLGLDFQAEQHEKGPKHFSTCKGNLVFELYPPKGRNESGPD